MIFAAVIVTYNRLQLLKETLNAFDCQTRIPDHMIVVNNASTDGTDEFLLEWKKRESGCKKTVITNVLNTGGSGGFRIGTQHAMETDADWIWVSDDDAIPNQYLFEKAEKHIDEIENIDTVSAICASVWTGGRLALSNRSRRIKSFWNIKLDHICEHEYENASFFCDNFSYVGVLMNKRALKRVGLINDEYFIWRDDVEHSWRLSETGIIICYPDMVIDHRIKTEDYSGVTWKTYYGYRNDIMMLREFCSMRYVFFKVVKTLVRAIISRNSIYRKMLFDAVKDGLRKKTGRNISYIPETWNYSCKGEE